MTLGPDDPRHGRRSGYTNHACRCPLCTKAHATYKAEWRARQTVQPNSERALNIASARALKWIRHAMPDVWDGFMDEAYDELGIERRPVGRPKANP